MYFTIVTPSFNYGHYIGECLESVAKQMDVKEERAGSSSVAHSAKNGRPRSLEIEHLIMDAGSKDDTADVVARYPHASFFQEPDKGMTDGINKGFRRAKGEWVMWLNSDDRLLPTFLESANDLKNLQSFCVFLIIDPIYSGMQPRSHGFPPDIPIWQLPDDAALKDHSA